MTPTTPLEYSRKNQISYEAARIKLNELTEAGVMVKTRLPNGRVYYVSTAPDIKAHDPFKLKSRNEKPCPPNAWMYGVNLKKDSPESCT